MDYRFYDYAFRDFTDRKDKGANWAPMFVFELSAKELVAISKTDPSVRPSLRKPARVKAACYLRSVELDCPGAKVTSQNCHKDPYAIFATVAHLSTEHGHQAFAAIVQNRTKRMSQFMYGASDFTNGAIDMKSDALGFYLAMFQTVGISQTTRDKLTFKIGALPENAPRATFG